MLPVYRYLAAQGIISALRIGGIGSKQGRSTRPFRSRKIDSFGVSNVREVERLMLETVSKPLAK